MVWGMKNHDLGEGKKGSGTYRGFGNLWRYAAGLLVQIRRVNMHLVGHIISTLPTIYH